MQTIEGIAMTCLPSDRAYAQAFREWASDGSQEWRDNHPAENWVPDRAREIDAAAPDGVQPDRLRSLINQYWRLAFAEGREGRNHDTEAGDAQRVSLEIDQAIRSLTAKPPAVVVDEAMVRKLLVGLFPYGYDDRWLQTATAALAAALGQGKG